MKPPNEKAAGVGQPQAAHKNNLAHTFSPTDANRVKLEFPAVCSLSGRILARLLAGRVLTHRDSWIELGHARLADSIWKLRRRNWPVICDERIVPTSDHGRKAKIGFYSIQRDVIEAAGLRARRFIDDVKRFEEAPTTS